MREIKFRAYYKPKKEGKEWEEARVGMHEVVALIWEEWFESGFLNDTFKVNIKRDEGGHLICMPDEVELMQSTGLFDKNGKEIYEGYIIQYITKESWRMIYVVEILPGRMIARRINGQGFRGLWNFKTKDVEIIGNIYENKDLLQDK